MWVGIDTAGLAKGPIAERRYHKRRRKQALRTWYVLKFLLVPTLIQKCDGDEPAASEAPVTATVKWREMTLLQHACANITQGCTIQCSNNINDG